MLKSESILALKNGKVQLQLCELIGEAMHFYNLYVHYKGTCLFIKDVADDRQAGPFFEVYLLWDCNHRLCI